MPLKSGLEESVHAQDGIGCEFWLSWIYIISHVHKAYNYSGSFGGSLESYGGIANFFF